MKWDDYLERLLGWNSMLPQTYNSAPHSSKHSYEQNIGSSQTSTCTPWPETKGRPLKQTGWGNIIALQTSWCIDRDCWQFLPQSGVRIKEVPVGHLASTRYTCSSNSRQLLALQQWCQACYPHLIDLHYACGINVIKGINAITLVKV